MSLALSFRDTTLSRPCSAPALPMILSGSLYVPPNTEDLLVPEDQEDIDWAVMDGSLMIRRSTGSASAS